MARRILFAFVLALTQAKHLSVPLTRHETDERVPGRPGVTTVPETLAKRSFWSDIFDVGDSKGLRLIIDTGSNAVNLNPGVYKPSSKSINLHQHGHGGYIGTLPDGCGFLIQNRIDEYKDTVAFHGLVAQNQTFIDTFKTKSNKPGVETQVPPHMYQLSWRCSEALTFTAWNGVVDFGGYDKYNGLGLPFFENLCNQSKVNECRFGLAFGTSGRGKQILGGVDTSLIEGELGSPARSRDEWYFVGGLASNGSIVSSNLTVLLDSGTPNVEGPIEGVRSLFEQHGIQAVEYERAACGGRVLFGYYPCDAPPQIGFQIGNTTLDIEPESFALKKRENNCTATIVGFPDINWIVGQAWMQGKYVDFDSGVEKSIRIAKLKDTVG